MKIIIDKHFLQFFILGNKEFHIGLITKESNLVKFFMCTPVSRVQMTFYVQTKRYTVPGNQGTQDKLNQIQRIL